MINFKNKSISKIEGITAIFIGMLVVSGGLFGLSFVATHKMIQAVCIFIFSISVIIVALLMLYEDRIIRKK